MAKGRMTDNSRFKLNRGTGVLGDYRPWLRVLGVPSKGRSHRVYCEKTKRRHEFFSDTEVYFFWICVWDDDIVDIREQFPLLPQLKIQSISKKFGYKHPAIPYSNQEIVMTTDFVLTKKIDGKLVNLARAVKTKDDLKKSRTREKMAIERQFWQEKGVNWALITEDSFSVFLAKNIKMLSNINLWIETVDINESHLIELYDKLLGEQTLYVDAVTIALQLDFKHGFEQGIFLNLVKYLIWMKRIKVDMTSDILDFNRVKILKE